MMKMLSDSIAQMETDRASLLGMHAITEFTPCVEGYAGTEVGSTFMCNNLDLYSFTPHADLGSKTEFGNDIWGWTHKEGNVTREFALIGESDGTAFVEVLSTGQVAFLGRLPTQTVNSTWRDIKVIGDHAYIGSEALGHGVQVFDLTKVLSIHCSWVGSYRFTVVAPRRFPGGAAQAVQHRNGYGGPLRLPPSRRVPQHRRPREEKSDRGRRLHPAKPVRFPASRAHVEI
jgi:hypothetical protein